jgi:hypothetical protein
MSEYLMVFPLDEICRGRVDEVSTDMAMLLDDMGENDVGVEFVTTRGGRQTLVKDPDSHSVHVGRPDGREGLLAACARSLSRLEMARDAFFSQMGRSRLMRCRMIQAPMTSRRNRRCLRRNGHSPPGFEPV